MIDPLEALKALREDPFADWRDAVTILPAALSHLCAIADDLADDTADDLARSLAVSLGDVLIAATTLGSRARMPGETTDEHAARIADVLEARSLGSRVPARPAPAPEHDPVEAHLTYEPAERARLAAAEDPWQWSWPDELRVGMKVRFPKPKGSHGPWREITAVPTQFYASWGRAFYLDEDEHLTRISNRDTVQTLLTDPDAVAAFYAEKRDRQVQP